MSFGTGVLAGYEARRKHGIMVRWIQVLVRFLQHPGFRGVCLYRLGHRARLLEQDDGLAYTLRGFLRRLEALDVRLRRLEPR